MTALDRLARRIVHLERRLDARNHPQLSHQEIADGAIQGYVGDQLTLIVGQQHDGTSGAFGVSGPKPYPCSAPTASVIQGGATIVWDGTFPSRKDDAGNDIAVVAPMDFSHVDIVLSSDPDFDPLATEPSSTIVTARGGKQFITLAPLTTYYCALIVWTLSGKYSDPSGIASFTTTNDAGGSGADILEEAEAYADSGDVDTLASAKTYADSGDADTLAAAEAYTDAHSGSGAPSGPAGGGLAGTYPNPTINTDAVGSAQIAPLAVGTGALAPGAVTNSKIGAGAVTDAQVAAANKDGTAATPSMRTLGTGSQQAAAGNDSRLSDSRTPTGAAGGDLTGTYPNPTIAAGAVGSSKIAAGAITNTQLGAGAVQDTNVAAANKDGTAATPSMRTLGTGSTQAAAGNDSRLSDSRTPSGAAGGKLSGTYPNPGIVALGVGTAELAPTSVTAAKIATATITDAQVAAANKDGAAATPSMRTLGTGSAQAAAGNDSRLSDARTPTAHASTHASAGSDPVTPAAIGADVAGAATSAVAGHVAATDPHGDRAYADANKVPNARQVAAGTGLTGGGDLSADRTLAVSYGSAAGTAAQGNDSRLSDARTPTAHASTHAVGGSDPLSQGAWTNATLTNGWVAQGSDSVAYLKDDMGVVRVRGRVKTGTAGSTVFTLPAGFRPTQGVNYAGVGSNGATALITIGTGGSLSATVPTGATWVSIDFAFTTA